MKIMESERAVALNVLGKVLEGGAYANIALREALGRSGSFEKKNSAFVTELVYTTIRNLRRIDFILNRFSTLATNKMEPDIRNLLRLSLCQMRFMDKVPAYAALNEAVELAKALGHGRLAGFVNGVLRSAQRNPGEPRIDGKNLGLVYSYPDKLLGFLSRQIGEARLLEFLEGCHAPPPLAVFPNTVRTTMNGLREALLEEGAKVESLERCLVIKEAGDIQKLGAYKRGLFFVMDPGAYAAAEALGMQPGETLVDLAAAPGGKSFAAACMMENQGRILAFDIHPHKIKLIESGSKRLGLSAIEAKIGDALALNRELFGIADAALVDAPCTGLGTLRRHPESKLRFSESESKALANKQLEMLKTAAEYLKPGGRLVYATCTVSKEENQGVAGKFASLGIARLVEACQTLPSKASDGFFVAKFIKNLV